VAVKKTTIRRGRFLNGCRQGLPRSDLSSDAHCPAGKRGQRAAGYRELLSRTKTENACAQGNKRLQN